MPIAKEGLADISESGLWSGFERFRSKEVISFLFRIPGKKIRPVIYTGLIVSYAIIEPK